MTGLVGWWPLHRTEGDAVDLSGNGNHGTVNGTIRGVAGRGGLQSHGFPGTGEDVNMGDVLDLVHNTLEYTWGGWMYMDGASEYNLVSKYDGLTGAYINVTPSGGVKFRVRNETTGGDRDEVNTDGSALSSDTWHHIMATRSSDGGSGLNIFIDGVEQSVSIIADQNAGTHDNSANFKLGEHDDGDQPLNGNLCDARVYNRVLSANEIQRLYEWGSGDYARPPDDDDGGVSYWTLDESSGDAIDQWGTNDGTVNGATQDVSGVRDTAYSFDGSNDYVDVGNPTPDFSGGWSIGGFVQPETASAAQDIFVFELDHVNGIEGQIRYNQGDRDFYTTVRDGTAGSYDFISSGPYPIGEWYHLMATWDSGTQLMKQYVNGVITGEVTIQTLDNRFATGLLLGGNTRTGRYLDGSLDDARLYTEALTPAEIHQIYRYGTRGIDMRQKTTEAR